MKLPSARCCPGQLVWLLWLLPAEFCLAQADPTTLSQAENDFYVVNVVDQDAPLLDSVGGFQARTGVLHPAGANLDLNFASNAMGGINIGTSFSGIRVNQDNAFTMDTHGGGTISSVLNLDPYFMAEGPSPGHPGNGWRTRWALSPEKLEIVQDFIVVGATSDQAAIYHTVKILNLRGEAVDVEWFNLQDFCLETDCGPHNSIVRGDGTNVLPASDREFEHAPTLTDELVKISDSAAGGNYDVYWSLSYDPGLLPDLEGLPLAVTAPDTYQFVQWATAYDPENFGTAENVFDYMVDPTKVITGNGGPINDSAGMARFSATIPREGSVRFTQVMFVAPVPEPSSAVILWSGIAVTCGLVSRRRAA